MKLLFDQNLSFRLVADLADLYPDSSHVRLLGLERADDRAVFDFAGQHDFTIVSKDDDFAELCLRLGPPPKLIWLNVGNCTTALVRDQLVSYAAEIHAFHTEAETTILVIGNKPPALSNEPAA